MNATSALDAFLLQHAPAPATPVDDGLRAARRSMRAALAELAAVPDSALERAWPWRGDEADVRYGFYRQYEDLEQARARVRALTAEQRSAEPPARPMIGATTAAGWDLAGLLAGLPDDLLDEDPGGGEWSVRLTLGHIVGGQRAYGWYTAWWHARRNAPADDFPPRVPDEVASAAGLPDESTEADGTLSEITDRLFAVLDQTAGVFAGIDDEGLAVRARWSGYPVDVRFRVNRWASHIREHTVQVEKTLEMIGRSQSEVARLLRLIGAAYGRFEEELYLWPAGTSAAAGRVAAETAAAVEIQAREIRAAAEAGAGG